MTRIIVATGMPPDLLARNRPTADCCLHWTGEGYNALVNLSELQAAISAEPPPLLYDLLSIAIAVYLSDIAVPRGRNEAWPRDLALMVPVREPAFWNHNRQQLSAILHALTKDNFRIDFCAHQHQDSGLLMPAAQAGPEADCVSALSGGLDSLAGAAMLLRADRQPLFVTHCSGNPEIRKAQAAVTETLQQFRRGASSFANLLIQPRSGPDSEFAFPAPRDREASRRSRSLLFMTLLVAAAYGAQVREAYLCENGILTVALPLSAGRIGSLSTRSTHPAVLHEFNALLQAADLSVTILNPFVHQTKAELIRDILRPVLRPEQIQGSISCWMAGRHHRQCGGCLPCLLRRVSMLTAGMPDEAYEIDVLAEPAAYRGTEAYGNLIDLLTQAVEVRQHSDAELLMKWPQLLDLPATGVAVADVLAAYRRYADEVWQVMHEHFPAAAELMESVT